MTLTTTQYDTLIGITEKTKMDNWFWIVQDRDGNDYVKDIEENRVMSLKDGLIELVDGLVLSYLSENEKEVLISILFDVLRKGE